MRISRRLCLAAAGILILVAISVCYSMRSRLHPAQVRVTFFVENTPADHMWFITAVATNIGRKTLQYEKSPFEVRYQVDGVWTNWRLDGERVGSGLLSPGETVRQGFSLTR